MSLEAKLKWNDYIENKEKLAIRKNPESKTFPGLTDAEIWWGSGNRGHWLRLFKATEGPYSCDYLQAYAIGPIHSKKDLESLTEVCHQQSFRTKASGEHKTILLCCSNDAPESSKVYKVIIPISDIPRLLQEGKIRSATRDLPGLKVEHRFFKTTKRKATKKPKSKTKKSKSKTSWVGKAPLKLPARKNKKRRKY